MNHPTAGTDTTGAGGEGAADATGQRLREAFTEAAYDVTPPPVPLEAIERDGRRRRRRRRAAALSTGCGLLLAPLVVLALRPDDPSSTVRPMAPPSPVPSASASSSPTPRPTLTSATSAPPAGKVRVVAPDERVTTEEGTELWLTADGKHWRDPDPEPGVTSPDEFRSLVDGNLDTGEPGLSMQGSGSAGGGYTFHGLFYGVRSAAAGVRITAYDGKVVDGTVLRLKGNTSWGVYYGHVKVPEDVARSLDFENPVHRVTVYDADDKVIAEMDFGP